MFFVHGVARIPVGKAQNQAQNGLKCIGHQGVYRYVIYIYIYLFIYSFISLCVNTAAQSTLGKAQNRAQISM